jgi:hypothetical protein
MENELKTYGDLKAAIKSISLKQKGEKIAGIGLSVIMGFIPGAEAAKTTYDFIKAAISKPDSKKTNTWLDKLDIDDNMSKIIDDTIENGFMQTMAKIIEKESDSKPLEQNFNMNQKLVDYLKKNYSGRTLTGIKENQMKTIQLRQTIKEEIKQILKETETSLNPKDTTIQGSFKPDLFQKLMGSAFESSKFSSAMTKLKNNQSRSATDNAFLGDVVRALMYTDDAKILTDIFNYLKTLKTKAKS